MADNWRVINDGKTEFMILCSRLNCDPGTFPVLHIVDQFVSVNNIVCNLSFIFDSRMSFVQEVNSTVKYTFSEVGKLSMIRKSLTPEAV